MSVYLREMKIPPQQQLDFMCLMNLKAQLIQGTREIKIILGSHGLLSKSLRGGSVLAVGSFIENLLRFIRNIVLARLLAPEAFGIMATVISSVSVLEAITQVGLRQSTIQNRLGSEEGFLNSVWWISSLRGFGLYIIAFVASPFIAAYFNQSDSVSLLRIGFLVILLNGLISPRVHILERELRFRSWVILMQGSGIIGVMAAIVAALSLGNVWALLLGFMAEASLRVIVSFIICPIKPQLRLDKKYTIEIMQFSRRLFGLPLLMMLYAQADIFIIGKLLSIHQLGTYVLVKGLAEMPSEFFSKIVHPITLPVFASMQDDRNLLATALFSTTRITGIFTIPFAAFLGLFSEPILKIVYGVEYSRLALPFAILNVSTLILMLGSLIVQMYFAVGQPDIHRTASLIRTGIFLLLIYPATKMFGVIGAASASLIAVSVLMLMQLINSHKIINFNFFVYMSNLLPGLKMSLLIIIPGIFMNIFFDNKGMVFFSIGVVLCLLAWGCGILKTVLHRHDILQTG